MDNLIGHDSQIASFRDAALSDRLHHAWLLAGPEGVGKAGFATRAASWLLARAAGPDFDRPDFDVPIGHPITNYIAAGSHPDLRILTRLTREKTDDLARSISIDQVRGLQSLFSTTPSLSPRRVVIIDAIDDLERPAANALLKNLEEPPSGTVFFLISHAAGRLLPTIRSRCRLLRFGELAAGDMTRVLRSELPEESGDEIAALVGAGEGAPGRALRFAGLDIAALDKAIDRLVGEGDPTNGLRSALAKQLGTKAVQGRYEAFLECAPARIAIEAKKRSGPALEHAIDLWEQARKIGESAVHLSLDQPTTVFELATMLARLAPAPRGAKA